MLIKESEIVSISEAEREAGILGLARQLLEQDAGLFVQSIAILYYSSIRLQAAKPRTKAILDVANQNRKKTREIMIPVANPYASFVDSWYDQDYLRATQLSTFSNLLGSPLFWDVKDDAPEFQVVSNEEKLYEKWLIRQWCGIKPDQEITVEAIIETIVRDNPGVADLDQGKLKGMIQAGLDRENYSMFSIYRAVHKCGGPDFDTPSLEDKVLDGTIAKRDVLIFLASKLEASRELFFAKARQLGFPTELYSDQLNLGKRLFGEMKPFAWLPRPVDLWPLLIEIMNDIRLILWEDWLPGWQDEHGIFCMEDEAPSSDMSQKVRALFENWPN